MMENGSVIGRAADGTTLASLPYQDVFERVFVLCLLTLVFIANILMGCELNLSAVLSTIKRPVAPAIGFFTQFAIMPLLAYSIALLVLSGKEMHLFALGLFVTGCSPGGGASNYWTILLGGNANLSVTMTFLSTIGALVMMPLWMRLLGTKLIKAVDDNISVRIPYSRIVGSLFGLIIPILIGLYIAKKSPETARKARKIMRPFIIAVLVFIILFGIILKFKLFQMITWSILLAGLLLPWCGFMFGCFTSILLAQSPPDVTAIAIETGVQNTGIAIILLQLSFEPADADTASLLPIVVACFTPAPLLLGYAIHRTIKYLKTRRTTNALPSGRSATPVKEPNEPSLLLLRRTEAGEANGIGIPPTDAFQDGQSSPPPYQEILS